MGMGERTNCMIKIRRSSKWPEGLDVKHDAKLASSEQSF